MYPFLLRQILKVLQMRREGGESEARGTTHPPCPLGSYGFALKRPSLN